MAHRIPRERFEAQALIRFTAGRWWAPYLHHSPNEELNATARQLAASQGTRAGFPDYILPIRSGNYTGMVLELKAPRPYGKAPTPPQRAWLAHFMAQGWLAIVAYGVEDAITALDEFIALGGRQG